MSAATMTASSAREAACSFCRRRLGGEYYFECRRCGASYCYIHMSRHPQASCRPERAGRPRPRPGRERVAEAMAPSANV